MKTGNNFTRTSSSYPILPLISPLRTRLPSPNTPPIDCCVVFRLLLTRTLMIGGLKSLQIISIRLLCNRKQSKFGHSTINLCRTYLIIHSEIGFNIVRTIDSVDDLMILTIPWLMMPRFTNGRSHRDEFASIPLLARSISRPNH